MAKSPIGLNELFEGRHFEREIIVLCVRWYLRFKLSFRDLVEMMAERGLSPRKRHSAMSNDRLLVRRVEQQLPTVTIGAAIHVLGLRR